MFRCWILVQVWTVFLAETPLFFFYGGCWAVLFFKLACAAAPCTRPADDLCQRKPRAAPLARSALAPRDPRKVRGENGRRTNTARNAPASSIRRAAFLNAPGCIASSTEHLPPDPPPARGAPRWIKDRPRRHRLSRSRCLASARRASIARRPPVGGGAGRLRRTLRPHHRVPPATECAWHREQTRRRLLPPL